MVANRRAVLAGGLAAAASVVGVAGVAGANALSSQDSAGLRPNNPPGGLNGRIHFDQATRDAAADDFGHIVHKTPVGVLTPESSRDVETTVRWTRALRGTIAPQGQSHSVWGRSMTSNGVVVDMSALHSVRSVQSDRVVVDAGAKWSEVLAATLPQGKTPPVLADYLELSVGGTLVVGGVGGTTSSYGVQADNVIELEVVTGRGDKVTCSPHRNSDLFDAVRAGLGQVGIVTSATLKLVAAPASVRRFLLVYPDLATFLHDARLLSGDNRFDAVQGAILPSPAGGWVYRLDAAKYFTGDAPDDAALTAGLSDVAASRQASTLAYFDYLNRLAGLEAALRGNGQWFFPHPWLTTFIGDSRVESVVSDELTRVNPPADLGMFGQVVLSPIKRSAISSPLLRTPSDSLVYAFNFVRVPTTADAANAQRLVDVNKQIYGRVKAAGGELYPVSALPMSQGDWRQHFGSAFGRLENAKRRYDPSDVMTPGYEVF
ncbi:MAG TPA: FAD-binding protein [Actinophytocola sp.]|jgi:FAD/FMN-containing dehydrogenase|nr:FAD-binding protein [Actinophytocola sp.]